MVAEKMSNNYQFFLHNVWMDESGNFGVDCCHPDIPHVYIDDIDNDNEFLNVLKNCKILNPSVSLDDIVFDSPDENRIDVIDAENEEPIGVFISMTVLNEANPTYRIRLSKKKNEWGEFVVKVYKNGKFDEEASYSTDDWDDAVGTFKYNADFYKLKITRDDPREKTAEPQNSLNEELDNVIFDNSVRSPEKNKLKKLI